MSGPRCICGRLAVVKIHDEWHCAECWKALMVWQRERAPALKEKALVTIRQQWAIKEEKR